MPELAGCAAVAGTEGPAINPQQQLLYSTNCGRRPRRPRQLKTTQDQLKIATVLGIPGITSPMHVCNRYWHQLQFSHPDKAPDRVQAEGSTFR
jgi:hypothetical protein